MNELLSPRLIKEEEELSRLSPLACKASLSRGRRQQEEPCPVRTSFERDTGRILYSLEFRRLRQKTQVFFDPRNDHICTRMEHVVNVSYIARTIGKALALNSDLIEAIALAHDLGHAPFGHSGERELDNCLRQCGSGLNFRHELHSLRVVDLLSERSGQRNGLNLSFEVRDGIVSHCGEKYQETEIVPWRNKTEAHLQTGARHQAAPATLEACVVRMADKIAYVGRDIEDAARAGLMRFEDIPEQVRSNLGQDNSAIINNLVIDIVNNSRGCDGIFLSPAKADSMEHLLEQNVKRIYCSEKVKRYEIMSKNVIQGLFVALLAAAQDKERLAAQQDEVLRSLNAYLDRHPEPTAALELRICDYIAGMTDHYASKTFAELYQC